MMSHNRLVFLASFAILAMTAVGLDILLQGPFPRRWWLWLPAALLAGLCAWCAYRVFFLPEPVETQLAWPFRTGPDQWIHDLDGVRRVQYWFTCSYGAAAVLCGLGVSGWFLLWSRRVWQRGCSRPGSVLVGDLLWFAYGRSAQCDPALYFPDIPVLQQVAQSLPAELSAPIVSRPCSPRCGLRDIRGYDAVDPARLVDLVAFAIDPQSGPILCADAVAGSPRGWVPEGNSSFSPVLDMLGVRYLVGRGSPPTNSHPAFRGDRLLGAGQLQRPAAGLCAAPS